VVSSSGEANKNTDVAVLKQRYREADTECRGSQNKSLFFIFVETQNGPDSWLQYLGHHTSMTRIHHPGHLSPDRAKFQVAPRSAETEIQNSRIYAQSFTDGLGGF